ncbi:hypothetical protein [Cohnella luojiensis]
MEKIKPTKPAEHHHMPKHPNQPIHHPVNKSMPMHKPVDQPAAKKAVTKSLCESHMHRYVEVQAADGYCYDGIVEHVDDEWVCLAVPGHANEMRGFFPGAGFYPPFGSFYPYRPRRFNRLVLPLAGLVALSLLPYYW